MKLLKSGKKGTQDLTELVTAVTWSGDIKSVARRLDFEVAASSTDPYLPKANIALGDHVTFYADGPLFDGFVFAIQKGSADTTLSCTCYDRGIYLKGNQGTYKFKDATPEEMTAEVCGDFGIQTGSVESAGGFQMTRNFFGVSLYQIIATAYTEAAAAAGTKYQIYFEMDKLCVREKKQDSNTLVIKGGSNLLSAEVAESIEMLCNRVAILDKSGAETSSVEDEESIGDYGMMQKTISASDNAEAQAKAALEAGEPSQKITLECLGDTRSITGRMVAVYEPYTGVWGSFWIDSDTHTWKRGVYTNKLTVNFKNIMDEVSAGNAEKTTAAASTLGTDNSTTGSWAYYKKEG